MQPFNLETQTYTLLDGFTLHKTTDDIYAQHWVAYRPIEDFTLDFETRRQTLAGVPFCYFVQEGERRVAGVIMLPNNIGDMFLIPPFADMDRLINAVHRCLLVWSDNTKPINAQSVLDAQLPAFQRLGYRVKESRQWMICPTEPSATGWGHTDTSLVSVDSVSLEDLTTLMYASFAGTIGSYGERQPEQHQSSLENYFEKRQPDSLFDEASCVVVDSEGKLIGACLVEPYNGLPTIRFVVVHPDQQGNGIGQTMMRRAIGILSRSYPYVTLAVTVGSPASGLYHRMGFAPAPTVYILSYTRS